MESKTVAVSSNRINRFYQGRQREGVKTGGKRGVKGWLEREGMDVEDEVGGGWELSDSDENMT